MRFSMTNVLLRLRYLVLVVGVSLLLASLGSASVCAQGFDRIERERAISMLGNIKDELKKSYYDPSFRGMDVDARFKIAEEKIKQASSLAQAFGIIAQALLDLNDSHTSFAPPSRSVSTDGRCRPLAISASCPPSSLAAMPKRRV